MSVDYGNMSKEDLISPEFYYCGNKHTKSDLHWIKRQLAFLNMSQKLAACDEYRQIYLTKGRKEANTYLYNYVNEHGDTNNVKGNVIAKGELSKGLQARIESIKASRHKKTILGMSDN
jgi:hypothetical protein